MKELLEMNRLLVQEGRRMNCIVGMSLIIATGVVIVCLLVYNHSY